MRRGLTRLLRLSSREKLKTGPGGGPVLRLYRRDAAILQSRFLYPEKSPTWGTPGIRTSTTIPFAYWTSGPQRRTDTRA
jgi:hypothetical protein